MESASQVIDDTKKENWINKLFDFIQLTKPRIMLLVIFSGATALFMDGSLVKEPLQFLLILAGLFLTGGSANALNQYFEREIDAKMVRTAKRRPLPQGKINANQALIFSVSIGLIGIALFIYHFNLLSGLLSLASILFYSLFYTLYLKPTTPQNIVIGGAAGAMPPLIAWAAANNSLAHFDPWILFLIIFFWTPPHFWALALYYKDDYIKANLPMMPVVKGDESTLKQIFIYSLILVGTTLTLVAHNIHTHWIYLVVAVVLGAIFIKKAYDTKKQRSKEKEKNLFLYSIIYLFSLFIAIIADSFIF